MYLTLTLAGGTNAGGAMGEAFAADSAVLLPWCGQGLWVPADPLGSTMLLAGHLYLQNKSTIRLSEGEKQNSWASINKTHHP